MKTKIIYKTISAILIFMMTFSYWGVLAGRVYAEYEEIEKQKVQTNHKSVEFDTYFKGEDGNTHTKTYSKDEIGSLYVNLSTKEGYLKQISVKLDNPNFSMQSDNLTKENEDTQQDIEDNVLNDEEVVEASQESENKMQELVKKETINSEDKHLEIADNEIIIDEIENQKEIKVPVIFEKQELIDADYFSKETSIILKAVLVDNKGKEKIIEAERKISVEWKQEVNVEVDQQIEKVIKLEDNRYLMQTNLKTRVKDNAMPVENTKIEILNPEIESISIEKVDMYAISTIMSNGIENNLGFTQENWEYDLDSGRIFVNINKQRTAENKIQWKDGENEFKIIYIFGTEADNIQDKDVKLQVIGNISCNGKQVDFENTTDGKVTLTGSLIDSNYFMTVNANKGYMYSKSNETQYLTKAVAEVSYSELVDYIDIYMNNDKFIDGNENKIETNSTVFKNTQINKSNFETLFGEGGKIEVFGNGEKITEITRETEANDEGNIVINYENEINDVRVLTSKPLTEGKLEILNLKAVKSETGYDREEINTLTAIEADAIIATNMSKESKVARMNLGETRTKAELTMVTDKISTVIRNEKVEIKVLFRTDSNEYDLYKNPYIEIELPVEIKDVEIESIAAAFGDGFSLNWYDVVETEEGKKVIRIALNGEQQRYAIDISEGMSIVINTRMTLDKKSGSKEETVKLRYRNENAIAYENNGEAESRVQIEAPTGVVAINSMLNYNKDGETAVSLSSKEQTGELEILTEKKTAKVAIDVVNNHEGQIENPCILGRLPVEGNKKIDGDELGSTFTAGMVRAIDKVEGLENANYKIYYSDNIEASKELKSSENGWTENIEDLEEVKSYLIVADGYTMEQGESMSFEYEVEIPEGLNHNKAAYSTYAVDYEVEEEGTKRSERVVAPTVGATTGEGPELEATLEANVENNKNVEEGDVIEYTVKVKNIGKVDAKNVSVATVLPEYVTYVSSSPRGKVIDVFFTEGEKKILQKRLILEDLLIKAEETFTAKILVEVKELPDNENLDFEFEEGKIDEEVKINVYSIITADDLAKEIKSNEYTNKVVKGNITVELRDEYDASGILSVGREINLVAEIKNVNKDEKNNIVVKYKVPMGATLKSAYREGEDITGVQYNEKDRTLNVAIEKLDGNEKVLIFINITIDKLEQNTYEKEIVNSVSVKADGMEQEKISNNMRYLIGKAKLIVNQTSSRDYEINAGEYIKYYIEVANEGIISASDVKLVDILPKELEIEEAIYEADEISLNIAGIENDDKNYEFMFDVPAKSKILITITAKADKQSEKEVEIVNSGYLINEDERININSLKHKIISDNTVVTPGGDRVSVYSISGVAWEDADQDGKKATNESVLPNIQVLLIDNNTGSIATKATSGEEQRTTTDASGAYRFTEVKDGEYIVVFLYNANKYTVTEYKKAGVLESENSDAIKTEIKIDGKIQTAGVTENIKINGSSASGINIGLVEMNSAIFSLNKVVTKMTMTNPKTTKTVEFNNSKLAKMDADWKYMNSTNFVIEYKIEVTNEGSIPGYVKKIVDNLPSEFRFASDLNTNWYSGNNGEVYTTSLANTLINPGETKEVTLVVTRKMTETGDGIFHNTAQISEVYNEYGAQNEIRKDTTKQSADVMIAVKTGSGTIYVSLIFGIFALMGIGLYFINKRMKKNVEEELMKIDKIGL